MPLKKYLAKEVTCTRPGERKYENATIIKLRSAFEYIYAAGVRFSTETFRQLSLDVIKEDRSDTLCANYYRCVEFGFRKTF